ncbi:MAG: hypothetical protein B6D63_05480 [Candidatus Latescibacteria bacterium 4484_7]|nr:MAG: hypothetical protein B6D63_05480 [Candidatus Latescibacteria bacterium 4484_7]
MDRQIEVLLVDDHVIVRQGIRKLLEEKGIKVIGEAGNGYEAINLTRELHPKIVVMDISLPLLGGIDATRRIKKEFPDTKVIMLTIHSEENYIINSLDAGANGYLLKEAVADELVRAIETVERSLTGYSTIIVRWQRRARESMSSAGLPTGREKYSSSSPRATRANRSRKCFL